MTEPRLMGPGPGLVPRRENLAWLLAALLAAACLLYVVPQQWGPLRQQALQGDELFFGACAARAEVDGWASVAGCHDNKAPLIYLLHAALQQVFHPQDTRVLKVTSAVMLALLVGMTACLAARLAPGRPRHAAVAAGVLVLCAFAPSPSLLAVKTEFLGMLFVMLTLVLLSAATPPPGLARALGSGVAMGAAVMSKQSFALLLPAFAWGLWQWARPLPVPARGLRLLMAGVGLVLPALALAALFASRGRLDEFLSTTFLYPAVYGNTEWPSLAKRLLWQSATASDFLQLTPVHLLLVIAAGLAPRHRPGPAVLRAVVLQLCPLSLAILLASPALFKYHTVPFWALSALLGGALLAEATAADEVARRLASAGLLAAASLALGYTLLHNDGRPLSTAHTDVVDPARGRFLYVLGMEPTFYARGFIPASSVQFPWALPGTPATWAYRPPPPGTALQQRLAAQQQRNLQQLYADFARTPPAYIVIIDPYARREGSPRHADVPGFDEYLAQHCRWVAATQDTRENPGQVFACASGR